VISHSTDFQSAKEAGRRPALPERVAYLTCNVLRMNEGSFGNSESKGEARGFLALTARPGFYIVDGLVLEPEILWTAVEGTEPSFSLSGNLAYNFNVPKFHVTPFVLIGYGTGNAILFFSGCFSDPPVN